MDTIRFQSLETLMEAYPIGSVYDTFVSKNSFVRYYFNDNDLAIYRQLYQTVTIIDESKCEVVEERKYYRKVDGYIYDGSYWYPAEKIGNSFNKIDINKSIN